MKSLRLFRIEKMNLGLGLLAVGTMFLTACTNVTSKKVVGAQVPANLTVFAGRWKPAPSSDSSQQERRYTVTLKDASLGLMSYEIYDPTEKTPSKGIVYFRTLGKYTFINIMRDGESEYTFGLVTAANADSVTVIYPNRAAFARLVDSGVLRGSVEYDADHKLDSVSLEGLTEEEVNRLVSGAYPDCFNWGQPAVFLRASS